MTKILRIYTCCNKCPINTPFKSTGLKLSPAQSPNRISSKSNIRCKRTD